MVGPGPGLGAGLEGTWVTQPRERTLVMNKHVRLEECRDLSYGRLKALASRLNSPRLMPSPCQRPPDGSRDPGPAADRPASLRSPWQPCHSVSARAAPPAWRRASLALRHGRLGDSELAAAKHSTVSSCKVSSSSLSLLGDQSPLRSNLKAAALSDRDCEGIWQAGSSSHASSSCTGSSCLLQCPGPTAWRGPGLPYLFLSIFSYYNATVGGWFNVLLLQFWSGF